MLISNEIKSSNAAQKARQHSSLKSTSPANKDFKGNKQLLFSSQKALANYNAAFISFKGKPFPEVTQEFIRDLTANPRNGSKRMEKITRECGDNYKWRFETYDKAFKKFTEQQLKNAQSLEELIKFRPDWKSGTLRKKYQELHNSRKIELGQAPAELGGKKGFEKIARHLTDVIKSQANNVFSKNYEAADLEVNGQNLKFKALSKGKTSKVPFIVKTESGQKFVFKINPDYHEGSIDKLDSCDSVALSAIIDFYLTLNNCENGPKVHYYNEKHNAAIYDFIPDNNDGGKLNNSLRSYGGPNEFLKDFNALGMRFNDTMGCDNIHYHDGKYTVIDNGHCTFSNSTKPIIRDYHKELPNNLWMSCFFG